MIGIIGLQEVTVNGICTPFLGIFFHARLNNRQEENERDPKKAVVSFLREPFFSKPLITRTRFAQDVAKEWIFDPKQGKKFFDDFYKHLHKWKTSPHLWQSSKSPDVTDTCVWSTC